MMTSHSEHHLGSGDDPPAVDYVWYEFCEEGHTQVIYVCGIFAGGERRSGGCPVCAAYDLVTRLKGEV